MDTTKLKTKLATKANRHRSRRHDRCVGPFINAFILASVVVWGCSRSSSPDSSANDTASLVTFNKDIAPIIFQHCAVCHRPGESAPFALVSFAQVQKRAAQIVDVTRSRYMPPWLPEPGYGEFIGERRLSDQQIAMIAQWAKDGIVEGNPVDLRTRPIWTKGWQLGEPDLVVEMPESYTLAPDGVDVFRNFIIPIPVSTRRYVKAVELRPGNAKIVHHAVMQVDPGRMSRRLAAKDSELGFGGMSMGGSQMPEGHFLGWSPGKMPAAVPEGMSWPLEQNSDLVLQLHMRPTGKPEDISSRVGFYFADRPPNRIGYGLQLRYVDIDIPPGAKDYEVERRFVLPVDVQVLGVYPHAHYLGKQLHGFAELPDGSNRWLFRIDDWDFNWQDQFQYAKPISLPSGSTIVMRYTFDNSAENEHNPHSPPKRVVLGKESTDEMANLWIQLIVQDQRDLAVLKRDSLTEDRIHYILYYKKQLKADPDNMEHHLSLAVCYRDTGRPDLAIEHYQLGIGPDTVDPYVHINFAIALIHAKNFDESIDHLRRAIAIQSNLPYAHLNLGNALMAKRQRQLAITHYRRAIEIEPNLPYGHNSLGLALGVEGNLDEAIEHFLRAIQIKPDFTEAHRNLAIARQRKAKSPPNQ